jgi:hypothetical protein
MFSENCDISILTKQLANSWGRNQRISISTKMLANIWSEIQHISIKHVTLLVLIQLVEQLYKNT